MPKFDPTTGKWTAEEAAPDPAPKGEPSQYGNRVGEHAGPMPAHEKLSEILAQAFAEQCKILDQSK